MTARRTHLYKLDGHTPVPCDLSELDSIAAYVGRRVGVDHVGPIKVSTVFLGVDHNHFGEGPPLLFETMIFDGPLDGTQERYATWNEAEAGHARWVEAVRAAGGVT